MLMSLRDPEKERSFRGSENPLSQATPHIFTKKKKEKLLNILKFMPALQLCPYATDTVISKK